MRKNGISYFYTSSTCTDYEELPEVPGAGGHRSEGSTSLEAIVATFIPTFTTAVCYLAIFVTIRTIYRNIYTPRTYIGVVPEKYSVRGMNEGHC